MEDYKKKYLEYKVKYIELKKTMDKKTQAGGALLDIIKKKIETLYAYNKLTPATATTTRQYLFSLDKPLNPAVEIAIIEEVNQLFDALLISEEYKDLPEGSNDIRSILKFSQGIPPAYLLDLVNLNPDGTFKIRRFANNPGLYDFITTELQRIAQPRIAQRIPAPTPVEPPVNPTLLIEAIGEGPLTREYLKRTEQLPREWENIERRRRYPWE